MATLLRIINLLFIVKNRKKKRKANGHLRIPKAPLTESTLSKIQFIKISPFVGEEELERDRSLHSNARCPETFLLK